MTSQPTAPRTMTPNQLRAVVYHIARTYLEVERGLRPPRQMAGYLSSAEYHRHCVLQRGRLADPRPVRASDIGRVRLDAITPEQVRARLLARRDDDTWSALLVDLEAVGRGWQVARLDRLERLLPREPRHVEIDEDAVARRRRSIADDRRAAEAAYASAASRYERSPDKRTRVARSLRDERDRWSDRIEALQDEARTVSGWSDGMSDAVDAAPPSCASRAPHRAVVESVLGARPDRSVLADAWDRAERAVEEFGRRWHLDSPDELLRASAGGDREPHRRDLLRTLAEAAGALELGGDRVLARELEV